MSSSGDARWTIGRRDLAKAALGGATLGSAVPARAAPGVTPPPAVGNNDLGFLRRETLADVDRLRFFMRERGLDAIAVTKPANVFYLSNHWSQLDRMGFEDTTIAVFAADPARPLALVMHAFLYYYTHSPESLFTERLVFPFTQPDAAADLMTEAEPPAAPARTMRVATDALMTERDRHRLRMFELAKPPSADPSWALMKAIAALGLDHARLGIDDPIIDQALRRRGFKGQTQAAENVLRRARLVKSPTELKLMRIAAQNNVDAAVETAMNARALASSGALRSAFYSAAGKRGNLGTFMIVAGSSAEVIDEPLLDGSSVSIDCVSTCRHYHGDFGRTIFVGEPRPAVKRAGDAIFTAWGEIRSQLRPGMRFNDIPRIGRETLKKLGADLTVSFNPHSVGLFHTDHPQPSLLEPRPPEELVLEKGMVLSVDCPLFLAGLGGTFHFENLMLIGADGADPIHSDPPPIIIV